MTDGSMTDGNMTGSKGQKPGRVAVVTGGAGFIGGHVVDLLLGRGYRVRVIDSMVGGRERNLAQHAGDPRLTFERRDIRHLEPATRCSVAPTSCSTSPASATLCRRSSGRSTIWSNQRRRAPCGCWNAPAPPRCKSWSTRRRRRATALPTCRPARIIRLRPSIPTRSANTWARWRCCIGIGSTACRPIPSASSTPMARASRTTGAYGAVFGVFFKQKLAGKPFTVIGDGTQRRDFLFVTDVASAFLLAAESDFTGKIWNLGAGNPQSVNRLVELLGGASSIFRSGRASPIAPSPISEKSPRDLGWKPVVPFDQGVRRMMEDIEIGAMRRCGTRSRSRSPPRPGSTIWDRRAEVVDIARRAITGIRSRSAEEMAQLIGERPRKRKVIMCHGVFDVVHPGHLRHLLYAKSKADFLVASLTADRHIAKGAIGRTCRRICARSISRRSRSSITSSSIPIRRR